MQRDVPAGTGSDPCWWWRCLATSRRCPQDTKLSHAWSPLALVAVRPISFVIWANGSGVPALAALSGAAAPRARLVHGFLGCSRECVLGCCILVHAPKQQENPLVVTHYCKHLPLANSLKFGGVSSSFPWLRCHARGPRAGAEPPFSLLPYSNIAEALVSKGLATVIRYRQDDDQRSSHYDELLAAEAR